MNLVKTAQADFVPHRLKQARLAKMLNMSELAEATGLTRQAISQFENSKLTTKPSAENLRLLASQLGVTERFFTKPLSAMETSIATTPSFRSRITSAARAREQARTYLEWMAYLVDCFKKYIYLPELKLPFFEIEDFETLTDSDIEQYANKTRRAFGLGDGPIDNLTLLLENHGLFIGHNILNKKLDALSAWFDGRPLILVNPHASAVRIRHNLAHELGHLILHRNSVDELELNDKSVHKIYEQQADYFAGCFLMPERTFGNEVYGIDFDSLVKLKERWLVSIASIIMRLKDIYIISDYQKQRLFSLLNFRNARRHEPLDNKIKIEEPKLFTRIIELLNSENLLKGWELADKTGLSTEFIEKILCVPGIYFKNIDDIENVVLLKRPAS